MSEASRGAAFSVGPSPTGAGRRRPYEEVGSILTLAVGASLVDAFSARPASPPTARSYPSGLSRLLTLTSFR